MKILGICGSLRAGSLNRLLLRAAEEQVPNGVTIEVADISGVPLFNEDVEVKGDPDAVRVLKEHVRDALTYLDALTLQSPWVYVPLGQEKFDASGALTDERARQQVKELVAALVAWTERLRPRV